MNKIPLVDIFAGPGGLNEGFSKIINNNNTFETVLSVEKDISAFNTLVLRSFFRKLTNKKKYFDYINKQITKEELLLSHQEEWLKANQECLNLEISKNNMPYLLSKIKSKINKKQWVLIGGPPCQAYSLIGRSRMKNFKDFSKDHRHYLYKSYLEIILKLKPSIFVLENVKGLISSKINGKSALEKIMNDLSLSNSNSKSCYKILGLNGDNSFLNLKSFTVNMSKFGIPQDRERIFIIGIHEKYYKGSLDKIDQQDSISIHNAIKDFPKSVSLVNHGTFRKAKLTDVINLDQFKKNIVNFTYGFDVKLKNFMIDNALKVHQFKNNYSNTNSIRSHILDDIYRYYFVSSYGKIFGRSPRITDFPKSLLPNHKNIHSFVDRFKVHLKDLPAKTITSHIAKDGHYYIHYDPLQCRSLSVREAARIQTFSDDYFFEGNQTQQYSQIGNAVPPTFAKQIGMILIKYLTQ